MIWYHAYDYLTDEEPETGDVYIKAQELVKEIYDEEINPKYILKVTWEEAQVFSGAPSEVNVLLKSNPGYEISKYDQFQLL